MAENDQKPGPQDAGAVEESVHIGDPDAKGRRTSPWAWVPTVYFAQGLQYVVVLQLFAIIFVTMGVPNSTALFWVGLLSAPWTLKPLWGPLVDRYWTKRNWTFTMQLVVGLCFLGAAFALTLPNSPIGFNLAGLFPGDTPIFFVVVVAFLFFLAVAGATHDIACDGYYMLGMNQKKQAFFVGMRSTAFRGAMIFATGVLFWIAGVIQDRTGLPPVSLETQAQIENVDPVGLERLRHPMPSYTEGQAGIVFEPTTILVEPGEESEVQVRLNAPPAPDEGEIAVRIRQIGGDRSFGVKAKDEDVDHQRLMFTDENWDTGYTILVTLHERVAEPTVAEFQASAGRIGFSWMMICLLCAVIMIGLCLYHRMILPYPVNDVVGDTSRRPPFIVPLAALAVTVGVPLLFFWGGYHVMGKVLKDPIQAMTIGFPVEIEEDENGDAIEVEEIADAADAIAESTAATGTETAAVEDATEVAEEALEEAAEEAVEVAETDADDAEADTPAPAAPAAQVAQGPTDLEIKGFNFFFNAGRLVLLVLIALVIIKTPGLRDVTGAAFNYMSDVSQIGFAEVFKTFFVKHKMGLIVAFLLTFRLGEAQLAQIKNIFLIDSRDQAGLAMTLGQLGFANSVVYLGALTVGGLLGGFVIARFGLKATTWFMVAAMHVPNLLYIWLATAQPDSLVAINTVIGVESFGYGFGFTYYLMLMILAADGPYKTAHYALCTGFMALGYMIPGMWSGYLQELVGYPNFFVLVMLFSIPGVLIIPFLPVPKDFGKKAIRT